MTSPTLELQQVSVYYGNQAAIEQASLSVQAGELMALVGPSGCGKSSLLASINRMTDGIPACRVSGTILLGGEALSASQDATALRRRIGMVFQQPNPFPLSIIDNLRFPLAEHGVPRRERDTRAEQALRAVGLWEEVKDRLSQSALGLSGGQQQRLCIARALVLEPQVLLLDEPCSALDPVSSKVVEELIVSLKGRYTLLMVTHNLAQARRIADSVTVCWMQEGCGCVVESNGCRQVFEHPSHPITAAYCAGEAG
ncbi:phosphate ABC transporter ATP-binding protein [Alcanivorax jadensis]|uniref:phosphate ABC transporter ATP-binding protein n=1 Tax=Alcanivorax jadensis TaxID=64988 RepID=UPI0026EA3B34|nr:phosphate ABC transporter ATP-binding protein [Alcanivorax jadensis]